MAEFMDLETFSPNWELILGVGDIMSCCIGLQNTLIVPTETSNIWLVGINTILTPILGKQVNIQPLGECIHPAGNRMQDTKGPRPKGAPSNKLLCYLLSYLHLSETFKVTVLWKRTCPQHFP